MNRPLRPSRNHLLRLPLAIALAAGLAAASLSGCGEEPPPPPPPKRDPPPPPPPPPPELSISALLQEMKADARVTFADSVKITDEALARGIINLADGFARGDAAKLRTVLDTSAQGVLSSLDATGEWQSSTTGIEAVRVVFVGDGASVVTHEENANPMDFAQSLATDPLIVAVGALGPAGATAWAEAIAELRKSLPERPDPSAEPPREQMKQLLQDVVKKLDGKGLPEDKLEAVKSAAANVSDEFINSLVGLGLGMSGASSMIDYDKVIVFAIQDKDGAFLLGWGTRPGESNAGHFGTAPTSSKTKRRATDFDNVGPSAFGDAITKAQVDPAAPPADGEKHAEDPSTPESGNDPAPGGGPKRKNTPGGPVTIPGSG